MKVQKAYKYKVAYLVPVYNHEDYILDTLNSIYKDILITNDEYESEVIIIDDGSTDNSNFVISNWINSLGVSLNITHFSRENFGVSATLNELIYLSNAQFIRLCSSDDLLIPSSTKTMMIEFQKNESLCAVCGDAIVVNNKGIEICPSSIEFHGGNRNRLKNKKTLNRELILNWCIAGPSILIKKDFFDDFKYPENEKIDDIFLYFSIINNCSLRVVLDKVCFYRLHSSNTSKTRDNKKRLTNLKSFYRAIIKFEELNNKYCEVGLLIYLTKSKILFLERDYRFILTYLRFLVAKYLCYWVGHYSFLFVVGMKNDIK